MTRFLMIQQHPRSNPNGKQSMNVFAIIILVVMVAGCEGAGTKQVIGTGAGAAIGGYAGSLIGKDEGRLAATAASGEITALHEAAAFGNADRVKQLLEGGADAGARAENGAPALQVAAKGGFTAVVRLLLKAGADVRPGMRSATRHAMLPRIKAPGACLNRQRSILFSRNS